MQATIPISPEITITIDITKAVSELSKDDKSQLYDYLCEDLGILTVDEDDTLEVLPRTAITAKHILLEKCKTFAEKELTDALYRIWDSRDKWTSEQRNRILNLANEKYV